MKVPNQYLTSITQVGVVVRDLNAAIAGMQKVFGVDPDIISHTPESDQRYYHGIPEPFSCKMAIYKFANIDIEFVEPEAGMNIWDEFLENGQQGLHHIRFSVNDFAQTVTDMQNRGMQVTMQGESMQEGLHFAYFDTDKLFKFIVEIFNEYEQLGNLAEGQ